MYQYKFKKLIKCSQCNANFRGIKERGIPSYICQNYSTSQGCSERNKLKEEDLLNHVLRYCNMTIKKFESSPEYMQAIVDKIVALPNGYFEIYYKDGRTAHSKENGVKYI
jgi:hypothetical protein